jgi:hypothetical protein
VPPPIESANQATPAKITLKIDSSPPGAAVYFDDETESRGHTPLAVTLPTGEAPRVLWLRLAHHRAATRAVVPDHDQALHFDLQGPAIGRTRPRPATEEAPREGHYQKLEE